MPGCQQDPRGLRKAISQNISAAWEPRGGGPGLWVDAAGFILAEEVTASSAAESSLTKSGWKKESGRQHDGRPLLSSKNRK